jgi:hypothetical protein
MGAKHSRHEAHCDTELVIHSAKELEFILETSFGAHGKGLHEKISSVQNRLPPALVKRMRFLATIRNRLVHERGFTEIPDRAGFLEAFDAAVVELNALLGTAQNGGSARKACAIA